MIANSARWTKRSVKFQKRQIGQPECEHQRYLSHNDYEYYVVVTNMRRISKKMLHKSLKTQTNQNFEIPQQPPLRTLPGTPVSAVIVSTTQDSCRNRSHLPDKMWEAEVSHQWQWKKNKSSVLPFILGPWPPENDHWLWNNKKIECPRKAQIICDKLVRIATHNKSHRYFTTVSKSNEFYHPSWEISHHEWEISHLTWRN
jgi:hypothetical protein